MSWVRNPNFTPLYCSIHIIVTLQSFTQRKERDPPPIYYSIHSNSNSNSNSMDQLWYILSHLYIYIYSLCGVLQRDIVVSWLKIRIWTRIGDAKPEFHWEVSPEEIFSGAIRSLFSPLLHCPLGRKDNLSDCTLLVVCSSKSLLTFSLLLLAQYFITLGILRHWQPRVWTFYVCIVHINTWTYTCILYLRKFAPL